MRKYILLFIVGVAFILNGCTEHLDEQNLYRKNLYTFYKDPVEVGQAMNGVYNALFVNGVHSNEHCAANLLSDLMLGAGGPDDVSAKNVDNFVDPSEDTYKDLWVETYNGVARANGIIEAVSSPDADYTKFFDSPAEADEFKNETLGEAYFMRGFLMFRAARFFGGMPLILSSDADRLVGRASLTETWSVIVSDFVEATKYFPAKNVSSYTLDEYGHANLWVAKAYIARAYMHYTGYMTNIEGQATSTVTLLDGSTIDKNAVIGHLNDIMTGGGYSLLPDFRNLWPYSYVNQSASIYDPNYDPANPPLPWAANEGLEWAGQDGPNSAIGSGNTEVMFALRYALADWSFGQKYNNRIPLFFGIRDNAMVPFGQGWGWGTVHSGFFNSWDNADVRKQGSVLDLNNDADMGVGGWNPAGDHQTGLMNKKYTTVQHNGSDGIRGMFYYLYNMQHGDPFQLWAAQDFYYLRYSDVLLMHSELTETATGLNQVRNRAGLADVGYSLTALKQERMYEFAFEGIRWFDLVRWGDLETNNFYTNTISVSNSGVDATYSVDYRPETKGLMPIPESEVRLSNGAYEPNPGW